MKHNLKALTGLVVLAFAWLVLGPGCAPAPKHSDYRSIHEYARNGDVTNTAAVLALSQTNLNLPDDAGLTPLHLAASYCHTNIIILLLNQGANVNATAKDGATPLHIAAQEGCAEAVNVLLLKGASVNARDSQGRTPLKRAELWHQDAIVVILREHGGVE